ncbi:hypothetical protein IP88_00720 [alpha proteobacterium AAP81b]|nr:hypothetical protein IP88_00720 [alpha proteobacterium AAP81b]
MTRRFTGWHMTAVMVGFFTLVIAVNLTMARLASTTFGGTVVDNSYVASQRFNTWLAAGRAQRALGWRAHVTVDAARHVEVAGLPAGAVVTATARHPLGAVPDRALAFAATAGGYRAAAALPAGRYLVRVDVRLAGHLAHFDAEVPA